MSIPISPPRQASMNKATKKLIELLDICLTAGLIDGYKILEDSQSLADLEDGNDFKFLFKGEWRTASSRITDWHSNYVSMRALRTSGRETELVKKLRAQHDETQTTEFMFHWHLSAGKTLHHFYIIKTNSWLNFFKNNVCDSYMRTYDNCVWCNIPAVVLKQHGLRHFVYDNNKILPVVE